MAHPMLTAALIWLCVAATDELLADALADDSTCEDEGMSALQKTALQKMVKRQSHDLHLESNRFLRLASPAVDDSGYEECKLESSDCSLPAMEGKRTFVYPGGDTRCFNGDPYAFAVVPGDADKLLVYFEGGGACFEVEGNVVKACTTSLSYAMTQTGYGKGIQNRSDERNPFKAYTVVEPLYCSGDAFAGNTMQNWGNERVYQHGYHNALATATWVMANFQGLDSLVISGYSAGALGTMAWANWLLQHLPHRQASVIADSYAAVFPPGTEEKVIQVWKTCGTGLWSPALDVKCIAGKLMIKDAFEEAMRLHPGTTFGNIQSKLDESQRWFYKTMAQASGLQSEIGLPPEGFYAKTVQLFAEYSHRFPNYAQIFVDGDTHVFTAEPYFYSASTVGRAEKVGISVYKWVQKMIEGVGEASACHGLLVNSVNVTGGGKYCDARLYPKVAVR